MILLVGEAEAFDPSSSSSSSSSSPPRQEVEVEAVGVVLFHRGDEQRAEEAGAHSPAAAIIRPRTPSSLSRSAHRPSRALRSRELAIPSTSARPHTLSHRSRVHGKPDKGWGGAGEQVSLRPAGSSPADSAETEPTAASATMPLRAIIIAALAVALSSMREAVSRKPPWRSRAASIPLPLPTNLLFLPLPLLLLL